MSVTESVADYMSQYVTATLTDLSMVEGECFAVDPVTQSIVIITKDQENNNHYFPHILLAHAVESIRVGTRDASFDSLEYKEYKERFIGLLYGNSTHFKPEKVFDRRDKLKKWLEENRLPVTIVDSDGSSLSVVNGLAIIEAPYTVESCRSTNTIILDRVMRIVKACPDLGN